MEAIQQIQSDLHAILRATGNNGAIALTEAIVDLQRISNAAILGRDWGWATEGEPVWISE